MVSQVPPLAIRIEVATRELPARTRASAAPLTTRCALPPGAAPLLSAAAPLPAHPLRVRAAVATTAARVVSAGGAVPPAVCGGAAATALVRSAPAIMRPAN